MGEIYVKKREGKKEQKPTFAEDLKEVGSSFVQAARESLGNVFSTFGISRHLQ